MSTISSEKAITSILDTFASDELITIEQAREIIPHLLDHPNPRLAVRLFDYRPQEDLLTIRAVISLLDREKALSKKQIEQGQILFNAVTRRLGHIFGIPFSPTSDPKNYVELLRDFVNAGSKTDEWFCVQNNPALMFFEADFGLLVFFCIAAYSQGEKDDLEYFYQKREGLSILRRSVIGNRLEFFYEIAKIYQVRSPNKNLFFGESPNYFDSDKPGISFGWVFRHIPLQGKMVEGFFTEILITTGDRTRDYRYFNELKKTVGLKPNGIDLRWEEIDTIERKVYKIASGKLVDHVTVESNEQAKDAVIKLAINEMNQLTSVFWKPIQKL